MLDALRDPPPAGAGCTASRPDCTCWSRSRRDVDDRDLAERARAAGVLVQPLSRHRIAAGAPGLVLGYAAHPPDRIREAVARLGATLRGWPSVRYPGYPAGRGSSSGS